MYTVRSSEQTRKKSADTETKALLYLMNFHPDGESVNYFVVDFFNDITGMDSHCRKLWDIQSKGSKSSAKELGRELVTLFKNFCSVLNFVNYILFVNDVGSKVRKDATQHQFGIENFTSESLVALEQGLREECAQKTYINSQDVTDKKIAKFLEKVTFVVNDKEPADYIKKIMRLHSRHMNDEVVLTTIFNEIRDTQASKKNSEVEGITVCVPEDALYHSRHLTVQEIKMLIVSRIAADSLVRYGSGNIPTCFGPIYNRFPHGLQREMLEKCQRSVYCTLFDKNNGTHYWNLMNEIYTVLYEGELITKLTDENIVEVVYQGIDGKILDRCYHLDITAAKYFIAQIIEGLPHDY